jgi:hypothetical protein
MTKDVSEEDISCAKLGWNLPSYNNSNYTRTTKAKEMQNGIIAMFKKLYLINHTSSILH